MQFLRTQFRALCSKTNLLTSSTLEFHTQTCLFFKFKRLPSAGRYDHTRPEYWMKQNETEYPIQQIGEEPRKAELNYLKEEIPVSWKNLWYIAKFIEGMSIDEALKQLSFVQKKGAYYAKDALIAAQELAVKDHSVEFKSNLWIATSFAWREPWVFRGIQRKAKRGPRKLRSGRTGLFLTLREGTPPENYRKDPTVNEIFEEYMKERRGRKIMITI